MELAYIYGTIWILRSWLKLDKFDERKPICDKHHDWVEIEIWYNLFMKYLTKEHEWGSRSVPTSRTPITVPLRKPCYLGVFNGTDYYVAIFNNSLPYERFYLNGKPTTKFINKGDAITSHCTYEEGCEHTTDFMLKDTKKHYIYQLRCGVEYPCDGRFLS